MNAAPVPTFAELRARAANRFDLKRTDPADGKVTYFAVKGLVIRPFPDLRALAAFVAWLETPPE